MFENTLKNIDDILCKDAGVNSELDYIAQTSWVLFLRYLNQLEQKKQGEAELPGQTYASIIEGQYRWGVCACPKTPKGELDHHEALTGPDLIDFVNQKLFPYLAGFRERIENSQSIQYKMGEIFSEIKNEVDSGYNFLEILGLVDSPEFRFQKEKLTEPVTA